MSIVSPYTFIILITLIMKCHLEDSDNHSSTSKTKPRWFYSLNIPKSLVIHYPTKGQLAVNIQKFKRKTIFELSYEFLKA